MPKVDDTPAALRAFRFHGVDLTWSDRADEATGDCPFCGKGGKFGVNVSTGKWNCFVCGAGGDKVETFLRRLYDDGGTGDAEKLAADRRLLSAATLRAWGVVRSPTTGDWLVPGYGHGPDRKLDQLYKYVFGARKRLLMATPGADVTLIGLNLYDPKCKTVYLCEGPWDAMALWEVLRQAKRTDDGTAWPPTGLEPTGSLAGSLGKVASVLAVTGAGVFKPEWYRFFAGKDVVLLFDNDHPVGHNGTSRAGAGYAGMWRTAGILGGAVERPETIHYLHWGDDGYDPSLPSGYDVRDWLTQGDGTGGTGLAARVAALDGLLGRVEPVPVDWIPGRTGAAVSSGRVNAECLPCRRWEDLVLAWRKAVKWSPPGEGLDHALACVLASAASTKAAGDQLWFRVIGPASCGKSMLAEALSTNRSYVTAKSTIRGFHSGYKTDKAGDEDHSLITLIQDKTLVTKDGDTLLQAPNLTQILSEARDVYDRVSRTHYRHGVKREYANINMTWLLFGTGSLRQLDTSELGERFLDCVVYDGIPEGLEDEIALRKAYQASRDLDHEVTGADSQDGPEMSRAKRMTGGYLGYLRDNAHRLLREARRPDEALRKCTRYAKFVACLRARPSARQAEKVEREMCFRLTSQLVRLAGCLAVVLNRPGVDDVVMGRVHRVARDTARGRSLDVVTYLYGFPDDGAEMAGVAFHLRSEEAEARRYVSFLRKIEVAEKFTPRLPDGRAAGRPRYRLTEAMTRLYEEVMG